MLNNIPSGLFEAMFQSVVKLNSGHGSCKSQLAAAAITCNSPSLAWTYSDEECL